VCQPIVLFSLISFSQPPGWVTNIREYQVNGRLGLIFTLLLLAVVTITVLLGIAAALAGAAAAGGGGESLRTRLRIIRRRHRPYIAAAIFLRLSMIGVFALAAFYAYGRLFGPRLNTGLPGGVREVIGPDPMGWGLLAALLVPWLLGPLLRVRLSTAVGALAATFTHGRIERTAYALGARFGLGLMAILGGLWLLSVVVLIIQTIIDPVSSANSFQPPVLPLELLRLPLLLLVATVFAYGYSATQLILAEVFTALAQRRVRAEKQPPIKPDRRQRLLLIWPARANAPVSASVRASSWKNCSAAVTYAYTALAPRYKSTAHL
jgi:hypothetical protein